MLSIDRIHDHLAVHAESETVACFTVRKVALPADTPCGLQLVVSGDPYE